MTNLANEFDVNNLKTASGKDAVEEDTTNKDEFNYTDGQGKINKSPEEIIENLGIDNETMTMLNNYAEGDMYLDVLQGEDSPLKQYKEAMEIINSDTAENGEKLDAIEKLEASANTLKTYSDGLNLATDTSKLETDNEEISTIAKELAQEIDLGKQYLLLISNGTNEEDAKNMINTMQERIMNAAKELNDIPQLNEAEKVMLGNSNVRAINSASSAIKSTLVSTIALDEEYMQTVAPADNSNYQNALEAYNNINTRAGADEKFNATMQLYNLAKEQGITSDGKFWSKNNFERVQNYLKDYENSAIDTDYLVDLIYDITKKGGNINDFVSEHSEYLENLGLDTKALLETNV